MEESVGIYKGKFAIRDAKGNFIFQDEDIYLPRIIKRIDELLSEKKIKIQISNIIFQAMKDIFEINKLFFSPSNASVVPVSDPLYDSLFNYIKENPSYIVLKEDACKKFIQTKQNRKKFYAKSETFNDYACQRNTKLINDKTKKGYH